MKSLLKSMGNTAFTESFLCRPQLRQTFAPTPPSLVIPKFVAVLSVQIIHKHRGSKLIISAKFRPP